MLVYRLFAHPYFMPKEHGFVLNRLMNVVINTTGLFPERLNNCQCAADLASSTLSFFTFKRAIRTIFSSLIFSPNLQFRRL